MAQVPNRSKNELSPPKLSWLLTRKADAAQDLDRLAHHFDLEETSPGDTFERVVWDRVPIIKTHPLSTVGLADDSQEYPDLRALHVGDPDFWFGKLVEDYGNNETAWVIDIKTVQGDVTADDVQYAIADDSGNKGYSRILVTSRKELHEGVDFTYERELSADDLEPEFDPEEEGEEEEEYHGPRMAALTMLTLYRGVSVHNEGKNGRFYSPDKEFTRQFTQSGQDRDILKIKVNPALIYRANPLPFAGDPDKVDAVIEQAKAAGCKAVWCSEPGDPDSVFVFDRSIIKRAAKIATKAKFPGFEEVMRAVDTSDVFGDNSDEEDTDASYEKRLAKARDRYTELKDRYTELKDYFASWTYPKTIYRAIAVRDLTEIKTQNFGVYWSWEETAADTYNAGMHSGKRYVVRAQVNNPTLIDWTDTFRANFYYEEEQEVTLKMDAPVTVTGIKKGRDSQWQAFPAKTVTAADNPTAANKPKGITNTPAFKAWFAGSKVVDDQGRPRVVYHGSSKPWIASLDVQMEGTGIVNPGRRKLGGIWFTSSEENAGFFAQPVETKPQANERDFSIYGENGRLYGAVVGTGDAEEDILFTVGPYRTEQEAEVACAREAAEYNKHLDKDTTILAVYLKIVKPYVTNGVVPREKEFAAAKEQGCDGIIASDVVDGAYPSTVYVVFNGGQVKAVTSKSFDANDVALRASVKTAMKVNVPESEFEHFWTEPPPGSEEFWAFRFPPKAKPGDQVIFHMNKEPVAEAVISRIEKPGEHSCEQTGRFKNRYKVYWSPESFRKLEGKVANKVDVASTPQFKTWFRDSKVVDEAGNPLRVYHGTASDFTEFSSNEIVGERGFFFTDSRRSAAEFANDKADKKRRMWEDGAASIMPVYLSLQNPLIINMEGKSKYDSFDRLISRAKAKGHDGVIIIDVDDGTMAYEPLGAMPHTVYVAFSPNQIKSAIGNNGEFNGADNSITASTKEAVDLTVGVKQAASDEDEREAASKHPDGTSFMKSHNTGWLPNHAYDSERMFSWQTVANYPKLLRKVVLKDGREVELRQSGERNQYYKHGPKDKDGFSEYLRDDKGQLVHYSDEEVKQGGLPTFDTTIMAFDDEGHCVGQASDEYGADLVAVRPDYRGLGLGTMMLTDFRRQYKNVRQMGQMTPAGEQLAKSYYRQLMNPKQEDIKPKPKAPKILKVYRGLSVYNKGNGAFYSPDPEWARQFTQSGQDREIRSASILESEIYTPQELPDAGDIDAVKTYIKDARDHHCKAIRCNEGTREPNSLFVFDQSALKQIGKYDSGEGSGKSAAAKPNLTSTPAFKTWFRGSVLKKNGKPQVFWHGSKANFDKFEARPGKRYTTFSEYEATAGGFFFAPTKEAAQSFGSNVRPFYLRMERPLISLEDAKAAGDHYLSPKKVADLKKVLQPLISDKYQDLKGNVFPMLEIGPSAYDVDTGDAWIYNAVNSHGLAWDVLDNPKAVAIIKQLGYDGTIVAEDDGYSVFVVDPNQIKSATSNSGEFNPDSNSVTASKRATQLVQAIHRTSEANAEQIKEHGFSLENFGNGAGLDMLESPAGVFVSRYSGDDFEGEVQRRSLDHLSTVLRVQFPVNKIWEPTRDERIAMSKKLEVEWIMATFPDITEEQAQAVRRVAVGKIKQWGLTDILMYTASNKGEIDFKKYFAKKLLEMGYSAVEWTEPIHGVKQTLVLDPSTIQIIGKKVTASPDFGYSQYNDKEDELKQLKWDVVSGPSGTFHIYVTSPAGKDQGWLGLAPENYQGNRSASTVVVGSAGTIAPWRGTGLGQMLYDAGIEEARRRGYLYLKSDKHAQRSTDADAAWKRLSKRYPVTYDRSQQVWILNLQRAESKTASYTPSGSELATLEAILPRALTHSNFESWLRELVADDTDPSVDQLLTDSNEKGLLLSYLDDYLSDQEQISVDGNGLVSFWKLTPAVEQLVGDLPVALYHHTSSKLIPKIKKEGLRPDVKQTNSHMNSGAGVYLTTEMSGPAVEGYQRNAVSRHKGAHPVTLTVKTFLRDLSPDPDDEDISSGQHQFILSYVAPSDIVSWD